MAHTTQPCSASHCSPRSLKYHGPLPASSDCPAGTALLDESPQGNIILELSSWNKTSLHQFVDEQFWTEKEWSVGVPALLAMSWSWTWTKIGYFCCNKRAILTRWPRSIYKLFLQDDITASQLDASDYTLLNNNENSLSASAANAVWI